MSKKSVAGIGHKVDQAAKENVSISRDMIREWLKKDIGGVYVLLAEMLNSSEVIDAVTDVFWSRYQRFKEESEPSLFDPKEPLHEDRVK